MGGGSDMIIGRRGDSIMGRVLDRAFDIQSDFGAIEIVTERIAWIHFRNPPQMPDDEIWLGNGDRLSGAIQQDGVTFQPEGGSRMRIPRDRIHTVLIGQGLDQQAPALR